jgi:hypothetical protein
LERKPMKTKKILIVAVLGTALLLSACGGGTQATPTPTVVSIASVYTAVAQTLTVQAAQVTPTDTPMPTDTPTLGLSPTITPTLPASGLVPTVSGACDNSTYVSDVTFPDNTKVLPGQTMVKTWKVQNSGSCAWNTSYSVAFLDGTQMGGVKTNITAPVNSGYQITVSVTLTAPTTEGAYTGRWILSNASGANFGAWFSITIIVSSSAPTLTPTTGPTATGTLYTRTPTTAKTATLTRTSAPATVTNTVVVPPTETETPVPTDTATPTETPT